VQETPLKGQRIGYVRVSSFDQNPDRQLEQVQVDKVFTDKASGKDTQRPQLDTLLAFVREGDTVVVHSMDRWRATSMTCAAWCKSSPSAAYASSSSRNA
jgi:DNA invertase Pin-like site-specific DNA recombinase